MIAWILFLVVSTSQAQQQAVLPVPDLTKPGARQGLQQALDTKFSIQGGTITGQVSISTMNRVAMVNFIDKSIQTTAYRVIVASQNYTFNVSATAFGVCGTTVATTFAATGFVQIAVNTNYAIGVAPGATVDLNVLQDGAFISPWSLTAPMQTCAAAVGANLACNIRIMISPPAAGSHSYCLTGRTNSGGTNNSIANSQMSVTQWP